MRITPADDGMAHLYAYLPAVLAQGIDHRLRAGSRAKARHDPRTVDQCAPTRSASCFDRLRIPVIMRTPGGTEIEHAGLLSTIAPSCRSRCL